MPRSNRAFWGALVVSTLAIASLVDSYQISDRNAAQFPDAWGAAAAEDRAAGALQILPRSGVIAYISDLQLDQNAGTAAFLATQYAIAPRALVPLEKSNAEWVVGDFARSADFAKFGDKLGLIVVQDFHNGIVVFRRAGR